MRDASDDHRYERAAALLRRRERLAWVLERLEGMLRATHSAPRLVLAKHPVKDRYDANRACLSQARRIVRHATHILTGLGDDAFTIVAKPAAPTATNSSRTNSVAGDCGAGDCVACGS